MNNDQLLAKSNGCTLISHLKAVSCVAKHLALKLGADEGLAELCGIAGLVHDIGKAWPGFQSYLTSGGTTEWDDQHQYHNEIGYVVLTQFLKDGWCSLESTDTEFVAEAVLWHHSCRHGAASVSLSPSDTASILSFVSALLGDDTKFKRDAYDALDCGYDEALNFVDRFVPEKSGKHPKQFMIRTCLIAADREISSIADQGHLDAIVDGSFDLDTLPGVASWFGSICASTSVPAAPTDKRSLAQTMCAEYNGPKGIIQVNAPTGFGKTRVGVLRTLFRGRRAIWVCPRNTVADAVFSNVLEEIEALGFTGKISAELYYTSKRQLATENCPEEDFSADIIVTNIDMLLKPMVDNKCAGQAFTGLCSDIVFDEYHEFASPNSAMFASFVSLLKARALCKDTSTMCLSATPAGILDFVFPVSYEKNCVCLPARRAHFDAIHSKPYTLHLHDNVKITSIPEGTHASLVMLNSVRNAQNHYMRNRIGGTLVHSKYTKNDRTARMTTVLGLFGPHGDGRESENFVVSGPVLQAALNISFKSVHLSSGGAEQDLQASRTNRFGELAQGDIHWYNVRNKGEASAIDCRWDRKLQQAWFSYALANFGVSTTTTLNDIYAVYNRFYEELASVVNSVYGEWVRVGYSGKDGHSGIKSLAPRRYSDAAPSDRPTTQTAGKGTLRNIDGSYNIAVKSCDTGDWLPVLDAFSVSEQEFDSILGKDKWYNSNARHKSILAELHSVSPAWALAWKKALGNRKIEKDIRRAASNQTTPMPVFALEYNTDLGLVSTDIGNDAETSDFVA